MGRVASIILPLVDRYSWDLMTEPEWKRLPLSLTQAAGIIAQHRFVFIGGPHRGGTTLLWRLLAAHPSMSAFDEHRDTDFGEGSFLQTVMPTFGVGREAHALKNGGSRTTGIGVYALSPNAHLTEASQLLTDANRARLVSEWGWHWNLSRPVLIEKTPTNMVASRLLQAFFTLPAAASPSFIFISRHPLAVSLAHRRLRECRQLSILNLNRHWLVSHEALFADLGHLRAASVIRYEDLVRDPTTCVAEVLTTLRLPPYTVAPSRVSRDTNSKYEREYCEMLARGPTEQRRHCAMANALQPRIGLLGLGYDLGVGDESGFACIRDALPGITPASSADTPASSAACAGIEAARVPKALHSPLPRVQRQRSSVCMMTVQPQ